MKNFIVLKSRLQAFNGTDEKNSFIKEIIPDRLSDSPIDFAGADWKISLEKSPVKEHPDALDFKLNFKIISGTAENVSVAAEIEFKDWNEKVHVMLPAAAYAGNRFNVREIPYPPLQSTAQDVCKNPETMMTDLPRLGRPGENSALQILAGDETTPAICFFNPVNKKAFIWLFEQKTDLGENGIHINESDDRSKATLRLEAPGIRRKTLYTMSSTKTPSWDRPATMKTGDSVMLKFRIFEFHADRVQDLFDRFFEVRLDLAGNPEVRNEVPFSAAWKMLEEKYNRDNWREQGGHHYYALGVTGDKGAGSDWQIGWVGGGMMTLPMLFSSSELTRRRAMLNLDWILTRTQSGSGLFYPCMLNGSFLGDNFHLDTRYPHAVKWTLVRKQADFLYFILKQFMLLEKMGTAIPNKWTESVKRLADRLVHVFESEGQLGQFLDIDTGEIRVGGSTCGAMAPGALALAGSYFKNSKYTGIAEKIALQFYERDVCNGISTGGPGEILQAPDSESAFALLESFVVLYENTLNKKWLSKATEMAKQCATWCASYDFAFPPDSIFGKAGIKSAGSVWANVQNKHSAPGICTFSGDSLFKLFRYTGNIAFLNLIRETAHNITQYISRDDRPLGKMPSGWICERVNFSDWEGKGNVGGSIFGSSSWPEAACMLTTVEIPGIYFQYDTGILCVFDHLEVEIVKSDNCNVKLKISNPTRFDAETTIFMESSEDAFKTVMGQNYLFGKTKHRIPAGGAVIIEFNKFLFE